MENFNSWHWLDDQVLDAKKAGTEMEESMSFKKAKQILENAGCRLVRTNMDESYETTADDYDFMYMKVLFNNYDFDYARSYGPNAAYKQVLDRLREHEGDDAVAMVPSSYAEWEDVLGWSIGEEPPSDEWYN